jgi:hypothetical protein
MLENRPVTKRVLPERFEGYTYTPLPVDGDPSQLFDTLAALSPRPAENGSSRVDAGHLQLGLLRALLPGAADACRAGGGAGPLRR